MSSCLMKKIMVVNIRTNLFLFKVKLNREHLMWEGGGGLSFLNDQYETATYYYYYY